MSWLKIINAPSWQRKAALVGNEAWGTFWRIACHCKAQQTDGVIEERVALAIAGRQPVIDGLVAGGLLERAPLGFRVRAWAELQSKDESEEREP